MIDMARTPDDLPSYQVRIVACSFFLLRTNSGETRGNLKPWLENYRLGPLGTSGQLGGVPW